MKRLEVVNRRNLEEIGNKFGVDFKLLIQQLRWMVMGAPSLWNNPAIKLDESSKRPPDLSFSRMLNLDCGHQFYRVFLKENNFINREGFIGRIRFKRYFLSSLEASSNVADSLVAFGRFPSQNRNLCQVFKFKTQILGQQGGSTMNL